MRRFAVYVVWCFLVVGTYAVAGLSGVWKRMAISALSSGGGSRGTGGGFGGGSGGGFRGGK